MAKYHMRNKEKEITTKAELVKILKEQKYAVIGMCRSNEPYVVTLNYGYDGKKNALYFHNALKGLKIDFIKCNPNVCATVIKDNGYVTGKCSHQYRSVVMWGKMRLIEKLEEKKYAMKVLLKHLEKKPELVGKDLFKDEKRFLNVGIMRLDIEEMTGKKGD